MKKFFSFSFLLLTVSFQASANDHNVVSAPSGMSTYLFPPGTELEITHKVTIVGGESISFAGVRDTDFPEYSLMCQLYHDVKPYDRIIDVGDTLTISETRPICMNCLSDKQFNAVQFIFDHDNFEGMQCTFDAKPPQPIRPYEPIPTTTRDYVRETYLSAFVRSLDRAALRDNTLDLFSGSRSRPLTPEERATIQARLDQYEGRIEPSTRCIPTAAQLACSFKAWIPVSEPRENPPLNCDMRWLKPQYCARWHN